MIEQMDIKMSFLSQMKPNSNRRLRHIDSIVLPGTSPPLKYLGRIMFCCVEILDITVRRCVKEREKQKDYNILSC